MNDNYEMSEHCCAMMSSNLDGGETAIVYIPKLREYGIGVRDGGSSFIEISHCPWCGRVLPGTLREKWFKEIELRGFEVGDDTMPVEFSSDTWWKALHL